MLATLIIYLPEVSLISQIDVKSLDDLLYFDWWADLKLDKSDEELLEDIDELAERTAHFEAKFLPLDGMKNAFRLDTVMFDEPVAILAIKTVPVVGLSGVPNIVSKLPIK